MLTTDIYSCLGSLPTKHMKLRFLGPTGSTFSYLALPHMVELFDAPKDSGNTYIQTQRNEDIIPRVADEGGYAALAISSTSNGEVIPSIDSFGKLIQKYSTGNDCPFTIIGAVKIPVTFCMMANRGIEIEKITGIIAHSFGLKACTQRIEELGLETLEASSNGAAAEYVCTDPRFETYAALGPQCAAEYFGLSILEKHVESHPTHTTFCLIGPKEHPVVYDEYNQAIVVFSVSDHPGSLIPVLELFAREQLNLKHMQFTHIKNGEYSVTLLVEIRHAQIEAFLYICCIRHSMLHTRTRSHLVFGPFPVIPR